MKKKYISGKFTLKMRHFGKFTVNFWEIYHEKTKFRKIYHFMGIFPWKLVIWESSHGYRHSMVMMVKWLECSLAVPRVKCSIPAE
jgi:hypothetical protein